MAPPFALACAIDFLGEIPAVERFALVAAIFSRVCLVREAGKSPRARGAAFAQESFGEAGLVAQLRHCEFPSARRRREKPGIPYGGVLDRGLEQFLEGELAELLRQFDPGPRPRQGPKRCSSARGHRILAP